MFRSLALVGASAALFAAGAVRSELPPLSSEERASMSDAIVDAEVKEIKKTTSGSDAHADDHYTVQAVVLGVHKGKNVRAGNTVTVHYWRAIRRPAGWAGPGGQGKSPAKGERIKAFLTESGKDRYELLNPNGWISLKPPSTKGK